MRGRQKGQTKKVSIIKDPSILPYEIQIEEDQFILIDASKNKPLSYHSSLDSAIKKISRVALHAYSIEFTHPMTKEIIEIKAPLAEDLNNTLSALKEKNEKY